MNKIVIFTKFSRMAYILERELSKYNPVVLTGETKDRQAIIDKFNNDPNCKIFISTDAGSSGINLTIANYVINMDLPMSLGKLEQRNGRIRWHMQDRPVFFYNLIAKLKGGRKTVDSFVAEKIEKKQEISQLLLSDIKQVLQ